MSSPAAQITLPCEAAGFVGSHKNPALICYTACPDYIVGTLKDSSRSENGIAKSLPVDTFLLSQNICCHIAQPYLKEQKRKEKKRVQGIWKQGGKDCRWSD